MFVYRGTKCHRDTIDTIYFFIMMVKKLFDLLNITTKFFEILAYFLSNRMQRN